MSMQHYTDPNCLRTMDPDMFHSNNMDLNTLIASGDSVGHSDQHVIHLSHLIPTPCVTAFRYPHGLECQHRPYISSWPLVVTWAQIQQDNEPRQGPPWQLRSGPHHGWYLPVPHHHQISTFLNSLWTCWLHFFFHISTAYSTFPISPLHILPS